MNTKVKRVVTIIIAAIIIAAMLLPFIGAFTAYAVSQADVDKANKAAETLKGKINDVKGQKAAATESKKLLDGQIITLEGQIGSVNTTISELDSKLEIEEARLEAAILKVDEKEDLFERRMALMYEENAQISYLDVLFASENLTDFVETYEVMQELMEYDQEIIDQVTDAKNEVEEAKNEIADAKAERVRAKEELTSQKRTLDQKVQERMDLISALESDQQAYEKAYEEARATEQSLKSQLAAQLSKSGGPTKFTSGKFGWPTNYTTVTSSYGMRYHPVLKVNKLHTGTDFGAPYGSSVFAAAEGKVIKAEYNSAYGNMVVIDHGGGYSTLYAHASSLCVSAGQYVTKGQTIMYVGSTGFSTGPHLHFEIMIDGKTTDPMGYLN